MIYFQLKEPLKIISTTDMTNQTLKSLIPNNA